MCRVHEALGTTPAVALGIADHVWSIGEMIDAALATLPIEPITTAPDRRRRFRVDRRRHGTLVRANHFRPSNGECAMSKNEKSGSKVGSIASKALRDPGSVTKTQIKTLAASALTQRPDKAPPKKSK